MEGKARLVIAIICVLLSTASTTATADTFTMGFGEDPETNPQYNFYNKLYTAAFKAMGYKFSYVLCPSKRCSLLSNEGKLDGEPQRVRHYNSTYSNMVLVNEPIFRNRVIGLTTNPTLRFNSLGELQGLKFRLEHLRGSVWSKENLQDISPAEFITESGSVEQSLKRLQRNRMDIFFGLEAPLLKVIHDPLFRTKNVLIAGIAGENFSYPFLHKDHSDLAPLLAATLKRMKASGEYSEILLETMPYMRYQTELDVLASPDN